MLISLLIVQSVGLLVARQNTILAFENRLDTEGEVSLDAVIDGEEVTKVFSATKPIFISVEIDAITPKLEYRLYDLDLTVVYSGADYLYVKREEEWSVAVETRFVYEPSIAHLQFKSIDMDGMAWIHLELVNNEERAYYTLEIPKQTASGNFVLMQDEAELDIARIEVRDMQGRVVLRTDDYESVSRLPKGIYIVTLTYTNGKTSTRKIGL